MNQYPRMIQSKTGSVNQVCKQSKKQKHIYDALLLNSKASNSASYIPTKIYQAYREQNQSRLSRGSRRSNQNLQQIAIYQKLSQLSQRLKNIHHFYKLRIDEQKGKNAERNQVFMNIVEELQKNHNDKIAALRQQIYAAEQEKKQVSYVDGRITEIKGSIDDILKQSGSYKSANQSLEKKIVDKEQTIREKQRALQKLKKEQIQLRNQLEDLMKLNLKENKKQREMLEMIDNILGVRGS